MKRLRNSSFIVLGMLSSFAPASRGDTPATATHEEIPYSSLDEAMQDLHSKSSVTFKNESGWIVAYESITIVSWLLTPKGHPAYPSIVKHHIVNSASGAEMATDIRCFASQATCDKYFGSR